MAFEDYRIQAKNRHINEAFETYQGMKDLGFSREDIMKEVQQLLNKSTDPYRNKMYSAILNIVGVIDEKTNK